MEVTGLMKQPELNGVKGRVVCHISGKSRWVVELNDGKGKATVKSVNIILI